MPVALTQAELQLTDHEFEQIRQLVYLKVGINLSAEKRTLVRSRLGKLLRKKGFGSFTAFLNAVEADRSGGLLTELINAISTNTTNLFREPVHFQFLRQQIDTWRRDAAWCAARRNELRVWSSACSSGEEPHSIAMLLADALRGTRLKFRILATDISTEVLARAQRAEYPVDKLSDLPSGYGQRYFSKPREGDTTVSLAPALQGCVTYAQFNLMNQRYPFKHGFDVIFCRNVMIYFDKPTQEAVVNKMASHVRPGGFLLIGHSESLSSLKHPYQYVAPTIYRLEAPPQHR